MPGTWISVSHLTEYRYATRVDLAHHIAHLVPRDTENQTVQRCVLSIDPAPSELSNGDDAFGNVRSVFSLYGSHESLSVKASSRVLLSSRPSPTERDPSNAWEDVQAALRYRVGNSFVPESEFVFDSPYVPRSRELGQYALECFAPRSPIAEGAIDLMHRIFSDFLYVPDSTHIATPLLETFRERTGVCQDFAHVMIACLRSLGLSARYVSGYLVTEANRTAERPIGADASHAWISVYCPPHGWLDLDPTNNIVVQDRHVTVALGRDYGDVTPLRGVIRGGGAHRLRVAVQVTPAAESV
jgi:transglutaminase-like putative cysteine protease